MIYQDSTSSFSKVYEHIFIKNPHEKYIRYFFLFLWVYAYGEFPCLYFFMFIKFNYNTTLSKCLQNNIRLFWYEKYGK